VSVPVQRTRYFWHNTTVRTGKEDVRMVITVGVQWQRSVVALPMKFRNHGKEVVYCTPDESVIGDIRLIEHAARLNIELLCPMSGLETEEPVLQPGRIDVLLGQGQTAQVLRNLCLIVAKASPDDWKRIAQLMQRLFHVELDEPAETTRGAIEMQYRQAGVKESLDVAMAGRGFQQMLLIFAYLYSHKGGVLLVDEPDAHLEILRQKQVYVLLREIAAENNSQVVMVTHSDVILGEALDNNLTLLLEGTADDLAAKKDIKNALKHYGADHYVKARERGYVLYVEGGADVDILRAFAERLKHQVADVWDERINSFYVQDNYPATVMDAQLERVEGGFGITPKEHFFALRGLVPALEGLAILDNDGQQHRAFDEGGLKQVYWQRYEAENYFVSPDVLTAFAQEQYREMDLFDGYRDVIATVLSLLVGERLFSRNTSDLAEFESASPSVARLLWNAKTERMKLSDFAEEFFRRLAAELGHPMLLRKGQLHRLIEFIDPAQVPAEVGEKLTMMHAVFLLAPDAKKPKPVRGGKASITEE
jgi:ABC-type multidrug transport system ATPase subunit